MNKLDKELHEVIAKHIEYNKIDIAEILAVLANQIVMLVQCIAAPVPVKISITKDLLQCAVEAVEEQPNPNARHLN